MAATSPIKPAALKWARPARTCEDPTKLGRLAKRVEQAMALAINPEPVRLDPHMVGVSPLNRLFSIQQVHNTILRSIIQDGHDPGRPHVGVACEIRAPEKVASLVQYNEAMAARSPLMPKVDTDLMRYEGLSCTHYNMSLRLGKDGLASPAGDLAKAKEDDATFAEAATQGHWWIILPESLADTLKGDIAAWRNQDQNENQTVTDGEMIRLATLACQDYIAKASKVPGSSGVMTLPLAQIVTAACLRTPLRLNSATVGSYCRFVCQMGEERSMPLVDDFLGFWSASVDPKALAIPHTFFDALSKSLALKKRPVLRASMLMTMYTSEGAHLKTKPTPDQAGLITPGDLTNLAKLPDLTLDLVEQSLKKIQDGAVVYTLQIGHCPLAS